MAKGALNLLREMERKYMQAIKHMKGDDLVVRPPERVLRGLEENLEAVRRDIRTLEADEAKPQRRKKRASG